MKKTDSRSIRTAAITILVIALTLLVPVSQWAKVDLMDQDNKPGAKQSESARDGAPNFGARQAAARQAGGQCRSSDIEPPEANDTTFLADCSSDGDLDTSCTTGK